MTNLDYVTLKVNGAFIGNNPATSYRGQELYPTLVRDSLIDFPILSKLYNFTELHCLASETQGEMDTVGTPSKKPGQHIWARAKLSNNDITQWVYVVDGAGYGVKSITSVVTGELFAFHRHNLRITMFGWDARRPR
ncbi:MAG: hypothetical protein J6T57_01820 [Alphaproteobacteria bacterium]|nr:hypothetical protein [Alphaproteobacteria bacterium]